MFEETLLKLYKNIKPDTLENIIPIINGIRKFKKKPPISTKEKLCKYDLPDFREEKVIMIHGVSVGEIMSLEKLIKRVKEFFPDYKLVVTAGTKTGLELARKKYAQIADFICYFPLDIYEVVDKFLTFINPKAILIAETELWPNFALCAKEKNIELYIINGRISDKSYPSYLKLKKFFRLILNSYSGIFCQSEIDKTRFLELCEDKNKVQVMKNLKFEIDKKPCDIDLFKGKSKVLIAASTHKGEDEIAFWAYKKLAKKIPNLKLILAPRHLNRVEDVITLAKKFNLKYGLRTQNDNFSSVDVLILDTLGELSKIYSTVDVAYIGGSFNKTGGHNPLEAVIYSKPCVSGPSIKNFRDIYSILTREKASFVVKNKNEFYKILEKLLSNDVYYQQTVRNCHLCFKNQQGALSFVINKLNEVLK